jgi:sugar phosphate isomerase/epimerase
VRSAAKATSVTLGRPAPRPADGLAAGMSCEEFFMSQSKFSRRGFLGVAAGAGIGVASASTLGAFASPANAAMGVLAPNTPRPGLGLQLYSVRNMVSSLGFAAVFEELARIGFKEVEFAGYTSPASPGITTAQLKQLLDDNGLKAVGSHIGLNNLLNAGTREMEFARAVELGMPHIGTASNFPGSTTAEVAEGADRFNEAGQVAVEQFGGLKIYQHNHADEFRFTTDQPTVRRYDVFLAETDPRYVWLELDILWAFGGARKYAQPGGQYGLPLENGGWGFDPASYVVANPGRFPLFHVKDGTPREPATAGNSYFDVEFGAGVLPFRTFFDTVGANNYHHPLWEQDSAPSTPAAAGGAFGAAMRSYNNMHHVRTLTWLDELAQMLANFASGGRLASHVHTSLQDRLVRATSLVEDGSESRAQGYLQQLVARANNQIKGDADDALVRASVVTTAQQIITWLGEAEDRENEL